MKKIFFIIAGLLLFNYFYAQETSTFTDPRDGKTYKIVKIGDNWWFAQNLNYEMDGSWAYDNDPKNAETYGRLYTLKAAEKACPDGWHLPTEEEWTSLSALADENFMGGKLKATELWDAPNTGADNETGFSALPGGYRTEEGEFTDMGKIATFWSATEADGNKAWRRYLLYNNAGISRGMDKEGYGFSVRCIKDK